MNINTVLPHQWRDLAALEARVSAGHLLADELEAIAEILYKTSNKVRQIAQQIFDTVHHARHALAARDFRVVAQLERLQTGIQSLWITMGDMTPEEVAEELVSLCQQLEGVEEPDCGHARTLHKEAVKEIETLQFHYAFPGVEELEPTGPFASEITRMADEVRKTNSTEPLNELTATQRAEVLAQVGNPQGLSAEGLAHAMESYLEALRTQAHVAQEFFAGRLEQGLKGVLALPETTREHIDQLIWEATQGEGLDPLLPESQALIANAVLMAMEQRMGFND